MRVVVQDRERGCIMSDQSRRHLAFRPQTSGVLRPAIDLHMGGAAIRCHDIQHQVVPVKGNIGSMQGIRRLQHEGAVGLHVFETCCSKARKVKSSAAMPSKSATRSPKKPARGVGASDRPSGGTSRSAGAPGPSALPGQAGARWYGRCPPRPRGARHPWRTAACRDPPHAFPDPRFPPGTVLGWWPRKLPSRDGNLLR